LPGNLIIEVKQDKEYNPEYFEQIGRTVSGADYKKIVDSRTEAPRIFIVILHLTKAMPSAQILSIRIKQRKD